MTKENKILAGVGAVAVAGLCYLYWKKKQAEKEAEETEYIPEISATTAQSGSGSGSSFDRNKLLKKGSKGAEVRELQALLNIKIDGDFGNKTLIALQKAKNVSQISLNAFQTQTTANIVVATKPKTVAKPIAMPKKDAKLMVSVKSTKLYQSKKLANGVYSNTNQPFFGGGDLSYGESAGIFKQATTNGTYLVQMGSVYAFVNGKHVKTY